MPKLFQPSIEISTSTFQKQNWRIGESQEQGSYEEWSLEVTKGGY